MHKIRNCYSQFWGAVQCWNEWGKNISEDQVWRRRLNFFEIREGKRLIERDFLSPDVNGCQRWWVSSYLPCIILLCATWVGGGLSPFCRSSLILGFVEEITDPHRRWVYIDSLDSGKLHCCTRAVLVYAHLSEEHALPEVHQQLGYLHVSRCSATTICFVPVDFDRLMLSATLAEGEQRPDPAPTGEDIGLKDVAVFYPTLIIFLRTASSTSLLSAGCGVDLRLPVLCTFQLLFLPTESNPCALLQFHISPGQVLLCTLLKWHDIRALENI